MRSGCLTDAQPTRRRAAAPAIVMASLLKRVFPRALSGAPRMAFGPASRRASAPDDYDWRSDCSGRVRKPGTVWYG